MNTITQNPTLIRLAILVLCWNCGSLPAQLSNTFTNINGSARGNVEKRIQRFEAAVEQLRSVLMIPGVSAAIISDQKLIWARGFGFADYEKRVLANEHTPYRIASLTKTFAATLVLQLVEHGKLSLDDPMSKYSNEFKDDTVRVRHILSHTSEGTPGAKYKYNGDRFAFLDAVIEKTTGKTFGELLSQKVLEPLNMSESVPGHDVLERTGIAKINLNERQRYRDVLGRLAKPYTLYGESEIVLCPYPSKRITTAADLISTVVDLAKYDAAIDRHEFLKPETQEMAWTPTVANDGRELPYGLGWFVQNDQQLKLVWHYGQWPSFSALYLKLPEKKLSLILLANAGALSTPFGLGSGDVTKSPFALTFLRLFIHENSKKKLLPDPDWTLGSEKFSQQIADFGVTTSDYDYGRELRARKAIDNWRGRNRARERKVITVDSARLEAYVGEYELLPRPVVITREGDKLMAEGPGQPKAELFAATETNFFLKVADADVTFGKDKEDKVTHLTLRLYGQNFRARKLK